MRVLSGIQPTGSLHLGNYFGAIAPLLARQKSGDELFIFVADWHALTSTRDPVALQKNSREITAAYLALGFDSAQTVLYCQSDVPEIAELAWILSCLAPMGLLERAVSFKDKTARGLEATVGLFNYPVLQAADILAIQPEIVPVGRDQKQHLEITRDLAGKFNSAYGETFQLPEPEISEATASVPGTDGQKMSKSYKNTIEIFADGPTLQKQIASIKTDSTAKGEPLDPTSCTVFQLYSLLATKAETAALAADYKTGKVGYGDAKKLSLEKVLNFFAPARQKFVALVDDSTAVEKVLQVGCERAREIAVETLKTVRQKVGLN